MDLILLSFGLLLIATSLTLLASGPRSWLMAMAQGLGLQAAIGAAVAAVQIGWIYEGSDLMPIQDRVVLAVQGVPTNAAGWTARVAYQTTYPDAGAILGNPSQFLPIAAIQMAIIAAIIASRKLRDESLVDPVVVIVFGLLIANSVVNATWPWWGS
jgi:hypothetical protein